MSVYILNFGKIYRKIIIFSFFQVRLKTSQAFHGVIHARDSRDNACLTYGNYPP